MATLTVIDRQGVVATIESDTGFSVMDVLQSKGQDIAALCGGACSCATCHVYFPAEVMATLPPRSEDERILVAESEHYREDQSRLSCQVQFTPALDGVELTLAPEDW